RNKIAFGPDTASERNSIAFETWQICDQFLDEPELWRWTDFRVTHHLDDYGREVDRPTINLVLPDFKSEPTLWLYTIALLTGITAIDLDTGGNVSLVINRYGAKLKRHISQCRVRDGFDRFSDAPNTLAEEILHRLECTPVANHKYALQQQCDWSIVCRDLMMGKTTTSDAKIMMPPGNAVLCTFPEGPVEFYFLAFADERGIALLRALADQLDQVLARGSLRQQFIGRFEMSTPEDWPQTLYVIADDGQLAWYRLAPDPKPGQWIGPRPVGTDWQQFVRVLPAG